ncbi:MAG: FecR family protein [Bacteroidota bacterium]|nr:FecR family protein [Bacteroidota bacterium]MDP4211677.1 FecR family protein [Bacteroidota bacterium]MDP4250460.1 FecR family protein [Bacteroidota bacterium]
MRRDVTLFVFLLLIESCHHRPVAIRSVGKGGETIYKSGTSLRTDLQLPDGSKVLMGASSVIRIPETFNRGDRDVFLEGEALFNAGPPASRPFIVHTRALVIRINSDSAAFKIDGYPNHAGEEVDVLNGMLLVNRSYHSSSDNEPETLKAGEMVMINTDIDLMEKEKSDSMEVQSWISEDRK